MTNTAGAPGNTCALSWEDVAALVPKRRLAQHKGSFGHVTVFAGSANMPGAALLCLQGALRSGAGRVSWCTDHLTLDRAPLRPAEVLLAPWPQPYADVAQQRAHAAARCTASQAVVVGPGLGTTAEARAVLEAVLLGLNEPAHKQGTTAEGSEEPPAALCLDADALTLLARGPELAALLPKQAVLTPHPAEMARLLACTTADVLRNPIAAARTLAEKLGACVLLKGSPTTVVAADGACTTVGGPGSVGGPSLAHAGTGDVLCGLLAGLLAQGLLAAQAAAVAAFVHAAAGDVAAQTHGEAGTLASDVASAIGPVWRRLQR